MLGFAPALDMGLQNFRDTDQGSMLRVKGADGMLPVRPDIVSGVNILVQTLSTYRNGLLVQEAKIGDEMIWGPHYMVADNARHITLVPGDVILTGTPCHSRSVRHAWPLMQLICAGLARSWRRMVWSKRPGSRRACLGIRRQASRGSRTNLRSMVSRWLPGSYCSRVHLRGL